MSEPTLTRASWRMLLHAASGLNGVASAMLDLAGQAPMDVDVRTQLCNLAQAVSYLAHKMQDDLIEMDDAFIWQAPMFVQEGQSNV